MVTLEGTTLRDRYYLRSSLGSGGMADVYLAWDKARASKLAIKVLRPDLALNPKFNSMFKKEAELLKQLDHPNIVRIYEFKKDNQGGIVFIVMDLIEGYSLKEKIKRNNKPASLQEVSSILQPVSAALHYAHNMGVIHCDVKPANILIRKDGQVYLTDFGVARFATEKESGGTPWYMSYEQLTMGRVDSRTDVYALGVTAYEMLSGGKLPYSGTSESGGSTVRDVIEWEQKNLPLPPIQKFNRSVPSSVVTVLNSALNVNKNQRFRGPTDMFSAFQLACEHASRGRETGDTAANEGNGGGIPPFNYEDGPTIRKPLPEPQANPANPPLEPRTRRTMLKRREGSSKPSERTPRGKKRPARPQTRRGRKPSRRTLFLYCTAGQHQGVSFDILPEGLRIGRKVENQIKVDESKVSRWHAVIFRTRNGTYIRDENSSLGTWVNGRQIGSKVKLKHGDVIQIGYHQIFEYHEK